MKYEIVKSYPDKQFRRISGVKRSTFEKMTQILKKSYEEKHKRRGRKPKLSIENQLLAALEYWREYRTYAHIAASYGIAESNVYRSIKWIEETLIKDGTFSLPGKKELLKKGDKAHEILLIDATETPIERPQKNKSNIIPEKRKGIH